MATKLKDKIQDALDEGRMLVLGIQVLIGFNFRGAFEPGFQKLPPSLQLVKLASLVAMCVSFVLVVTPDAEHQIVRRGRDTSDFHAYVTRFCDVALFPFALGIALDCSVAGWQLAGRGVAIACGCVAGLVALTMWYGVELARRPPKKERDNVKVEGENQPTPVHEKIRHVLTEARTVLPGAQALLGFQFATMLVDGFAKLPQSLKWLHLASLGMMMLAIILLMTPTAWHRIVERGEETERFHHIASHLVVAALAPLALGTSGDFYIVARVITKSSLASGVLAGGMALLFGVMWFGLSLARRHARMSRGQHATLVPQVSTK